MPRAASASGAWATSARRACLGSRASTSSWGTCTKPHAHYFYPGYIYDNDQRLLLDGNEGTGRGTYSHDVIADRALEFIDSNKDRPFFCYVPFTIPHAEYVVPEDEIYAQYAGTFQEVELSENPNRPGRLIRPAEPHATLAAMITRMDRDVGRILQLIAELGLDEDTIVFFTSDNGAAAATWTDYFRSSGDLRGAKRDFYEGGIRVPMLARWPEHIAPGSSSDHVWGFHDFLATALELAGSEAAPDSDGISVVPTLLARGEQAEHEYMYWELPRYDAGSGTLPRRDSVASLAHGQVEGRAASSGRRTRTIRSPDRSGRDDGSGSRRA